MRRNLPAVVCLLFIALVFVQCQQESQTLFQLTSSDKTGVNFINRIGENDTFNILTHEYIYNGGGVGISDFNNDGLQDLFFAGNVVPNKLYLNKGNFQFQDISDIAGINGTGRWNSGVAIADINKDGWMDIYVCATMFPDSADRRNMLFINRGLDNNGIPVFSDEASSYGLEVQGYSVTAAFFDYDKDDDLDLFVLINQRMDHIPSNYRARIDDGSAPNNDRLYQNNGNGTFTDVTINAGITLEGFGLGVSVADVNSDGWPDIYVSNDYISNDALYINNRNGTFSNRIAEFIGHQSQFSMGNDAADINNDGLTDIITTDMLPETSDRKKTTIGNKNYLTYINNERYDYEYQYTRNMLHLNNGLGEGIKFSEIGLLSGVYQTEWSWSPLFADFDNDGHKDLIITNGFPKDVTDKDFANYRATVGNIASLGLLEDSIPVVKVPNYAFRNNGDLTFTDVTAQWGFNTPSFSNGAAFADLDNDGDLDYVVNNINDQAGIYQNTLYSESNSQAPDRNNFLRISLTDAKRKKNALGAKIKVYAQGTQQMFENTVYRGFLSSVEGIGHFGIGKATVIDSVVVAWSDGNVQVIYDPKVNSLMKIDYTPAAASLLVVKSVEDKASVPLQEVSAALGINFRHQEDDKIDFNIQRTLPHKFTQSGPGIAVGDLTDDGLEDIVLGGSTGFPFTTILQKRDGTFSISTPSRDPDKVEEDEGLLLFDADNDNDLDLYVVSGSIEHFDNARPYQDRLYKNNGKGVFSLDVSALPEIGASGSCVRAADFDRDGDLDLFVGGRVVPGKYPLPAQSYLLRNENGRFVDATAEVSPTLQHVGMITDALWSDFDNDNLVDLIVVGEFTPIMFFKNTGNGLTRHSVATDRHTGWWNSITAADFDLDGDTDYVVGNLGLNNPFQASEKFPLKIYAKDFDGNGSIDPILACYMRESMNSAEKKLFPVHFWDELNTQSPKFRNKFALYRQYSKATIDQVLTPEDMKDMTELEANHMATSYVENLGNGAFRLKILPVETQFAPVFGMVTDDFNNDNFPDIFMVGNDYGAEVFYGRYDAFAGLILQGSGDGGFKVLSPSESGFYVPGDAKGFAKLNGSAKSLYIVSQNKDSLKVFSSEVNNQEWFVPERDDVSAEITFNDGKKQKVEFYHGNGYLSQSSRKFRLSSEVKEIAVFNSRGEKRLISTGAM